MGGSACVYALVANVQTTQTVQTKPSLQQRPQLATVLCNEIVCCVFALTSVILPCWQKEEGELQREATMARSVSTNTMTVVIANFLVTTYGRLSPRCT